jgi:hypothetical protein
VVLTEIQHYYFWISRNDNFKVDYFTEIDQDSHDSSSQMCGRVLVVSICMNYHTQQSTIQLFTVIFKKLVLFRLFVQVAFFSLP